MWQTLPSPSRSAFTSTRVVVAVDQDVADRQALPDVSPFVHSFLRVRLKNVTYPSPREVPGFLVHEAHHQHFAATRGPEPPRE